MVKRAAVKHQTPMPAMHCQPSRTKADSWGTQIGWHWLKRTTRQRYQLQYCQHYGHESCCLLPSKADVIKFMWHAIDRMRRLPQPSYLGGEVGLWQRICAYLGRPERLAAPLDGVCEGPSTAIKA
jgi:hypothetical protein